MLLPLITCRSHDIQVNEPRHGQEWVVWHASKCVMAHVNESSYAYGWVTSHVWMSHVTPMSHVRHRNNSRHKYEGVMSHIGTSHVTRMNESSHTYKCDMSQVWVKSHIKISHVSYRNTSCHEWVRVLMSHITHDWVNSYRRGLSSHTLSLSLSLSHMHTHTHTHTHTHAYACRHSIHEVKARCREKTAHHTCAVTYE